MNRFGKIMERGQAQQQAADERGHLRNEIANRPGHQNVGGRGRTEGGNKMADFNKDRECSHLKPEQGQALQGSDKEKLGTPKNEQGEKKRKPVQEKTQKIEVGNKEKGEWRKEEAATKTQDESKGEGKANIRETQDNRDKREKFLKIVEERRPTMEQSQIGPEQRLAMLRRYDEMMSNTGQEEAQKVEVGNKEKAKPERPQKDRQEEKGKLQKEQEGTETYNESKGEGRANIRETQDNRDETDKHLNIEEDPRPTREKEKNDIQEGGKKAENGSKGEMKQDTKGQDERREENKGSRKENESKKDEFRKHVEKAGVLELITKSLAQLCEEETKREHDQKDQKGEGEGHNYSKERAKHERRDNLRQDTKENDPRAKQKDRQQEGGNLRREEPNTKGQTDRREENKSIVNNTEGNEEGFRKHVENAGVLKLITRSLKQLCKEETKREQAQKEQQGEEDSNNSREGTEHEIPDTHMTKKTQDVKKDEFRTYLEKAGVLEHITKSLVQMCNEPEKPTDALEYLKEAVSGRQKEGNTIAQLKEQNSQLKTKIKEKEATQTSLVRRLRDLQKDTKNHGSTEEEDAATKTAAEDATAAEETGGNGNEGTGGGTGAGTQTFPEHDGEQRDLEADSQGNK